MDITRFIVKNTSFQVFGKVLTVLSAILLTWVLRSRFGNDGYGVYVFVSAFVLFFGNLADWGTSLIAVREVSKEKMEKQPILFTTSLVFRLALSVIAFIAANIVIRMNPEWNQFVLPTSIASFVLLFLSIKTSLGILFQALLRFGALTLIEVFLSLSFLFLSLVFLLGGKDMNFIMAAWVIATALSSVVSVWIGGKFLRSFSFDWSLSKKILKAALPTGTLLIVFSIYNRIDIIILQHFWGVTDVGVYGLSYKIYETLITGAAFIAGTTYPLLSNAHAKEKIRSVYQKTFDILLFTSLCLLGIVFILAPTIAVLWGPSAVSSILPLRILSIAIVFSYLNHLTGYSLIAQGKQYISLAIGISALVVNVIINLILIPHFSYFAAAWMTVATEGLVLLLSTVAMYYSLGIIPSLFSFPRTIYSLLSFSKK